MAIDWTPWFDAPMHRRLELLSVGFIVFCEIAMGPICTFFILLLIVILIKKVQFYQKMMKNYKFFFLKFQYFGNFYIKTICLAYLAFIYYDRHTGDQGGRGIG